MKIFDRLPAYFDAGTGMDYEIIVDVVGHAGSNIDIKKGDIIELNYDSGTRKFNLRHELHSVRPYITYTAVLAPYPTIPTNTNMPIIWASGRALDGNGDAGGEYYVYSREDSAKCEHRNNKGNICKSIHLEYFMDNHDREKRPGFPGVITEIGTSACGSFKKEASEGDGDHGRN